MDTESTSEAVSYTHLRIINNDMGHDRGDEYIRLFAELLREAVPKEFFTGRDGGDEFLSLIHI